MKDKRILFIIAHPDDEAYGPMGTIAKLNRDNTVVVLCMCSGDRSSDAKRSRRRLAVLETNCANLGVSLIEKQYSDFTIPNNYQKVIKDITEVVEEYRPDIVFTHNKSDIHVDHRSLADATMVACRPTPELSVRQLYMFETPSSTDWAFGQIDPVFVPNTYVDVSAYMIEKKFLLSRYSTEVRDDPDARSINAMETLAAYRGRQVGYQYAEAFKLIWSKN